MAPPALAPLAGGAVLAGTLGALLLLALALGGYLAVALLAPVALLLPALALGPVALDALLLAQPLALIVGSLRALALRALAVLALALQLGLARSPLLLGSLHPRPRAPLALLPLALLAGGLLALTLSRRAIPLGLGLVLLRLGRLALGLLPALRVALGFAIVVVVPARVEGRRADLEVQLVGAPPSLLDVALSHSIVRDLGVERPWVFFGRCLGYAPALIVWRHVPRRG